MKKIITLMVLCLCLLFTGGCDPKQAETVSSSVKNEVVSEVETKEKVSLPAEKEDKENNKEAPVQSEAVTEKEPVTSDNEEPSYATDEVEMPSQPAPVDSEEHFFCSLKISCEELVDNEELLDKPKREFVPEDGIIFYGENIAFSDGDTVFDILQDIVTRNNIQMEYVSSVVYDSAYIEGINNIYELDAGPMSGWTYTVNGNYPDCGTNKYVLENGDSILFSYILSY
ncbi:MAG: DUF4430 domain-containing protein [Firmicutes bacterium]|nr:DUF4430 domain-containing protein [Bacillota bacterium]